MVSTPSVRESEICRLPLAASLASKLNPTGTPDTGIEEIRAIKRVLYWARRIDPAQTPNQTPQMAMLDSFLLRDETTFTPIDQPKTLDENMPREEPAGTTAIWIRPAPATAEPFWTTVIDPDTHQAVPFHVDRETLR